MKFLFWVFLLIAAVLIAVFAVSNRTPTALGLWPLPFVAELPLYLAILAALAAGFACGAATVWLGAGTRRREARRCRRRLAVLERELAATQAQLPGPLLPDRST